MTNPPKFMFYVVWMLSTLLLFLIIYFLINIGNNYVPERKKVKFSNKRILPILGTVFLLYLSIYLLNKYTILSDTFYALIFSLVIAYALNPIINYLETKGMNRLLGVLVVYISILGVIIILAISVIPRSNTEIKRLINTLPKYFEQVSEIVDTLYTKYYSTLGGLPPMFQGIETVFMDNIVNIENMIVNSLKGFVSGVLTALTKVVSIVLTPILTSYFLVDKDFFKGMFKKMIPKKYKKDIYYLGNKIDFALSKFVRGRLLMSLYAGVATTIALMIFGVEFAIVIGFVTGLADIIPYVGPLLGYIPAAFFAFISSPIKALWVTIFFVFIQWAENNILAPKIIGENLGMHPLIILLSIIIGGGIFGVFGMILSVPVVAIIRIIFQYIIIKYKASKEGL